MPAILLFGPNEWGAGRADRSVDPWTHRQNLAKLFQHAGHEAELFEDLPEFEGGGLHEKLEREVNAETWDYVFVYLPVNADTASINSELTLLRQFYGKVARPPRVLLWCQDRLLADHDGELEFSDPPLKSA